MNYFQIWPVCVWKWICPFHMGEVREGARMSCCRLRPAEAESSSGEGRGERSWGAASVERPRTEGLQETEVPLQEWRISHTRRSNTDLFSRFVLTSPALLPSPPSHCCPCNCPPPRICLWETLDWWAVRRLSFRFSFFMPVTSCEKRAWWRVIDDANSEILVVQWAVCTAVVFFTYYSSQKYMQGHCCC